MPKLIANGGRLFVIDKGKPYNGSALCLGESLSLGDVVDSYAYLLDGDSNTLYVAGGTTSLVHSHARLC